MQTFLLAVLIGVVVGIVVGALGAGGGILAVPVLVYLLGQDPHAATASSLIIVAITALTSIRHHAKAGNVAWRDGAVFGAASVVGAVVASRVSGLVPSHVLMILFGAMLIVVALVMARRAVRTRREENGAPPDAEERAAEAAAEDAARTGPSAPALIATASFTGLLTGFFGVGGGFIVVPMLVIALGLAMRRASGTSLLVMIITTAVSLLSRIGTDVQIDWLVTLVFAAASGIGGLVGGPLSAKARPSTLTALFAGLLGVVALVTLGEQLLG
jgi:uncharacterized membrane protein YfcA